MLWFFPAALLIFAFWPWRAPLGLTGQWVDGDIWNKIKRMR